MQQLLTSWKRWTKCNTAYLLPVATIVSQSLYRNAANWICNSSSSTLVT